MFTPLSDCGLEMGKNPHFSGSVLFGYKNVSYYPNVTTLRSGLCYRKSVCRLSVICLSVTLVHPTQGVEAFDNISSPLCTLAIL